MMPPTFSPPDYHESGAADRLVQSLLAIQTRKEEKARQDMLDQIAMAEEQRRVKKEEDDRAIQLADLAQKIAALKPGAPPTPAPPVEPRTEAAPGPQGNVLAPAAGVEGVPEGVLTDMPPTPPPTPAPTPIHKLTVGGQTLDVPLYSSDEIAARKRQEKLAGGAIELTPEMIAQMPEAIRPFFKEGMVQEAPNISSLLGALGGDVTTRPENPEPVNIEGKETMATPSEIAKAKAAGSRVTPYRAPAAPSTTILPFLANMDGKLTVIDRRTGKPIEGIQPADTADMRNKVAGRALAKSSINAVEELSKKILTKVGPAQRAQSLVRGAEAVFGNDPEFRTYQDARMALAGNLAVAQQGSRPSDADIKAIWLPLVPDPYRDTSESATMKWTMIKTMMATGAAAKTPGTELPTETQSALDRLFGAKK